MKKISDLASKPYKILLGMFVLWRVVLFLIAGIGNRILEFAPRFPYADIYLLTSGLPHWIWAFANFDGVHYLGIVQKGYWAQYSQVFFPLFPLLVRVTSFGLPFVHTILVGLLVSNIFFFFSLIAFYKLLQLDYGEKQTYWIIGFLLLFPASFFFGSFYTEGLFFFLLVCSFYFARKKQWVVASIFAGLASATKLMGIFLLPALLWEWLQEIKNQKSKIKNNPLLSLFSTPMLYIAPLGLLSYMLYLQLLFGDALYFWHAQPVFGASRSGNTIIFLPQVFYRYAKIFMANAVSSESFWIPMLEFGSTLFAITALVWAHIRKVRLSYIIFSWFAILVPTLTGTFSSMPRYVLIGFPLYILLGTLKSVYAKSILAVFFIMILCILTVLFTAGHWVA